MSIKPEHIIAEVLGRPLTEDFNPAALSFECPFLNTQCIKRSTYLGEEPYPICSIYRKIHGANKIISVCPKRLYEINLLNDVVEHCWPKQKPSNPQIAPEVKMEGFGNVDFVVADVDKNEEIKQFISVEVQAIDITGSVMKAYEAFRKGQNLSKKPTYGLNWDNVYKRYVTQLIRKGYFHHHWGTKIVAVLQDHIYNYICSRADFMRSPDVKDSTVNIIFMSYRYSDQNSNGFNLVLDKVEGTSHANLQQAFMYKEAPSREVFCDRIKRSLKR